jgi:hypothetical protein
MLLLDEQLEPARSLFELDFPSWPVEHRDFPRLADWALVPDDAAPRGSGDIPRRAITE